MARPGLLHTISSVLNHEGFTPRPVTGPGRTPATPLLRIGVAVAVLAAIVWGAHWLHTAPDRGAAAAFSLLIGAAFGVIMQRGRFCFFCIFRDYIEHKDSRPFYSVLSALAVGSVCYWVVMSVFLPNPSTGYLPPDAHIGPVSWVLVVAGLTFGVGMALSGACVSGHLYRLGEGYARAPFALVGTVIGFGLGFLTWRPLYVKTISTAPLPWLPKYFGYGGSLAIQLVIFALLAILFLPFLRSEKGEAVENNEPTGDDRAEGSNAIVGHFVQKVFVDRWKPGVTGAVVGVLGSLAYLRVRPLGVTSQLGSIARTLLSDAGLLTGRLNGLDTFAGCITLVVHTISDNGLLIAGVVAASFAAALMGNHFEWSALNVRGALSALVGGVMMGWGSMLALGCTVGTLLSGIMAFSVSGWVFFVAVFSGVWMSIRLRLHRIGAS